MKTNDAPAEEANGSAASNLADANLAANAQPDPSEQFNSEAEKRARDLALRSGAEPQRMQERQQARQELQNVRFEVDISDRKLRVFQGDRVTATHDVAVGTDSRSSEEFFFKASGG